MACRLVLAANNHVIDCRFALYMFDKDKISELSGFPQG